MALEDGTSPEASSPSHHSTTPHPPKSPHLSSTTTSLTPNSPSHNHARSTPNPSRRHSLPLHFLPPALWSANTSTTSLVVESEEAALGEHILDEATVAHRISALRQLNGATRGGGHRYAKSTGARNSTFSQPVIVRTYSGARPQSQQRDIINTPKRENGLGGMMTNPKMDLKLPPIEAFSFKGIMDEIRHGVSDDLERIAEICARSKYSLSNQYEVHMPPHGRGEAFLPTTGLGSGSNTNLGPTLQAVGSDDEPARSVGRSRGGRRTKSVAYGTLETIISSSRSSDEDNSKKKAAAVIAEEVRGRAAKKELLTEILHQAPPDPSSEAGPSTQRPKHTRSKSATLAAVIITTTQTPKHKNENTIPLASSTSLISEPARPQTSTEADLRSVPAFGDLKSPDHGSSTPSPIHKLMSLKPATIKNESRAATLRREPGFRPSILGNWGSWLPWGKSSMGMAMGEGQGRGRSASHAEGSLRDLLKASVDGEGRGKGKGVDRGG